MGKLKTKLMELEEQYYDSDPEFQQAWDKWDTEKLAERMISSGYKKRIENMLYDAYAERSDMDSPEVRGLVINAVVEKLTDEYFDYEVKDGQEDFAKFIEGGYKALVNDVALDYDFELDWHHDAVDNAKDLEDIIEASRGLF